VLFAELLIAEQLERARGVVVAHHSSVP
jgi:hypothetical protein